MERNSELIRLASQALAAKIEAECLPGPAQCEQPGRPPCFDREQAAELIASLVSTMVELEREQCAELVERLEPSEPEMIAMHVRSRRLRG